MSRTQKKTKNRLSRMQKKIRDRLNRMQKMVRKQPTRKTSSRMKKLLRQRPILSRKIFRRKSRPIPRRMTEQKSSQRRLQTVRLQRRKPFRKKIRMRIRLPKTAGGIQTEILSSSPVHILERPPIHMHGKRSTESL